MSRRGSRWGALWIALVFAVAGVVVSAPALASTLWSGASMTRSDLELRVALASLPFAALIVLAIVMERAVRRVLR